MTARMMKISLTTATMLSLTVWGRQSPGNLPGEKSDTSAPTRSSRTYIDIPIILLDTFASSLSGRGL